MDSANPALGIALVLGFVEGIYKKKQSIDRFLLPR
jgi:hypothetical protein